MFKKFSDTPDEATAPANDQRRLQSFKHFDLSLRGSEIREQLSASEKKLAGHYPIGCEWQPEYGAWMVEAIPRNPYGSYVSDLINVEKSMQLRRKRLHSALQENEIAPSVSNFPMLGVFGYPHAVNTRGPVANSRYLGDEIINPHPRFGTLTRNIRTRRGENVEIIVPSDVLDERDYKYAGASISAGNVSVTAAGSGGGSGRDRHESLHSRSHESSSGGSSVPVRDSGCSGKSDPIHMDAMGFGMGSCCVQVTMQVSTSVQALVDTHQPINYFVVRPFKIN